MGRKAVTAPGRPGASSESPGAEEKSVTFPREEERVVVCEPRGERWERRRGGEGGGEAGGGEGERERKRGRERERKKGREGGREGGRD